MPPQPTLTDGELTLRPWRDEDIDLASGAERRRNARWLDLSGTPARAELSAAVERWRQGYADDRAVVNFVIELAGVPGPVG